MDEADVLDRLLRIPSPSGQETRAVRTFLELAKRQGFRTRVDRAGNGVASRGTGHPFIMFLGHIDTVPGERPTRRSRGRLSGRGAVDAKGALATALVAGAGFDGPGRLDIIAGVGEETDSRGAREVLKGPRADAVVAGEPNRWDGVSVGYRGCLRLHVTMDQPRTHPTSPTGTSVDRAVRWAAQAQAALESPVDPSPFHSTSVRVLSVARGSGRRDSTNLTIEARLPPGVTTDVVLSKLPRLPDRTKVRIEARIEPFETGRDDPVVRALVGGIRGAGGRPTLWRKAGTSDLNLVAGAWGIPGAAYGPGDPRLDHTDREIVSEAELSRAVAVLSTAFGRLAGGELGARVSNTK